MAARGKAYIVVHVTTAHMPEDPDPRAADPTDAVPTARATAVEVYETEDGVVLYDSGNPLAWIESRTPVDLADTT